MTLESIIRSRRLREDVRAGLLAPHIDGFVTAMARMGYTSRSFHDLVLGAAQFARYLTARGVTDPREFCDRQVENYVRTLPVYRCGNGYLMSSTRGGRAAHHLIRYLRTSGATPPEPVTEPVYGRLLNEWLTFLSQHRGLVAESVSLYRRTVEPFLQALSEDARPERFAALSPAQVRDYLQRQGPRLARVTRKNLVTPHGLSGHGSPGAPGSEARHRGKKLSCGQLHQAGQTRRCSLRRDQMSPGLRKPLCWRAYNRFSRGRRYPRYHLSRAGNFICRRFGKP